MFLLFDCFVNLNDFLNSVWCVVIIPITVFGVVVEYFLYCELCIDIYVILNMPVVLLVTYSLPQNGTIKLYKELRCPMDNFELVLFSLGNAADAQGKSYPLCPFCFNNPPSFTSMSTSSGDVVDHSTSGEREESVHDGAVDKNPVDRAQDQQQHHQQQQLQQQHHQQQQMGCNSCLHPTCAHSAARNAICPCPGTNASTSLRCDGKLTLDANSKPNWKLACNRCNTLLRFHGDIHSITPMARHCDNCGLRLVSFEFSKFKTPLQDGSTTHLGCIVCDDVLNGITEIIVGRTMHLTVLRQQQYKRGGGGRGSRGRGGGRGRGGDRGHKDVKMSFSEF